MLKSPVSSSIPAKTTEYTLLMQHNTSKNSTFPVIMIQKRSNHLQRPYRVTAAEPQPVFKTQFRFPGISGGRCQQWMRADRPVRMRNYSEKMRVTVPSWSTLILCPLGSS